MAPFVEREWGAEATELMWEIKRLADPAGVLAPGVVLNRDPGVHLRNLKSVPEVEESVTKCIECGFCEPVCPSQNLTTTPRQRIVLRREMARQPAGSPVRAALLEQYEYDGDRDVRRRRLVHDRLPGGDRHRHADQGPAPPRALARARERDRARGGAPLRHRGAGRPRRCPCRARRVAGALRPVDAAAGVRRACRGPSAQGAAAVYLPSCLNRIFGRAGRRRSAAGPARLPEALVAVSARARRPLWIPPDVAGHCCAHPVELQGLRRRAGRRWRPGHGGGAAALDRRRRAAGGHGRQLVHPRPAREPRARRDRGDRLGGLGPRSPARAAARSRTAWARSSSTRPAPPATSACRASWRRSPARLADEVVVPAATRCCGMAGDRGWLHPELPAAALAETAAELEGRALRRLPLQQPDVRDRAAARSPGAPTSRSC